MGSLPFNNQFQTGSTANLGKQHHKAIEECVCGDVLPCFLISFFSFHSGGGSGGTQSSAAPSSQFPAHSGAKIQETTATATSQKSHPKDPGVLSAIGTKVNVPSQSEQVGEIITTTTKKITSKTKSVTTTTAKFAHCQSDPTLPEEVSAEEDHHHLLHRNVGSTSTDLSHKLVPDGNDFKLVFISSDSSKDSELNSSLEGGISSDQEKQKRSLGDNKHSGGEFIDDEMEWSLGYRPPIKAKPDFIASSSPKLKKFTKRSAREDPSPPALPPKSKIYHNPHGLGSAFLDDYHFISSSSGGGSVVMSDGEKLPMALSSSPSVVHSIRTSATRDRSSPIRQSPRIPKVHNIPILREDPLPTIHQIKRSRSAHSIIEATESETSQDFEVQAILRKHPKLVVPNVSQKVNTGANLTKPKRTTKTIVGAGGVAASNGVGDLHNTSAEVEHYMSAKGFASITNNDDHHKMLEMAKSVNANGQHHHHHHHLYPTGNVSTAGGSIRSFEDRSLGEMSIHDQLVLLSELEGEVEEDPKIEHFRSYLLAEIKAYNESHKGSEGLLSTRSLSESDLSELCGASVQAPSPDELLRSFSPSSEQTVLKSSSNTRDETSSTSTGDTTYEKEKSTRRAARMTQGSLPDDVPRAEGSPPMLPPKNRRIHSAIDGGTTGEGGSGGCGGLRVPSTGHLGPQALTQMKGNAGIRAPSGSVSSSRASGGSSSASTSSTSSGCTVNNKFQLPETFVDIDQWQTQNNHGNGEHCSDKTNREFKSEYRLSLNPTSENQGGVYRSASSITSRPKGKAPVVKPVRRSKSHKATSVTNILHGGPVTFVSVNNINHLVELTTPENPCSEELFQGSHTLPRASGSNRTAKTKAKSSCSDDSDVIITNTTHMDSGGKGVRIQIGSGGSSQGGTKAGIAPSVLSSSSSSHQSHPHGRFPKQNSSDKTKRASKAVSATLVGSSGIFEEKPDNVDKNRIEQECQTSIDFRYSEYDTLASNGVSSNPLTSSARVSCPSKVIASTSSKNKKGRRKYTLEELEVEGFEPSSCSESEKLHISDADLDEDDIDLSSLIEGAVDDDDEEEEDDVDEEAYDVVNSIANNEAMNDPRLHMKPVQVSTKMQGNSDSNPLGAHHQARIQRVDDVVSSEDEDLLSMAVHQGSLSSHNFVALQPHSDTEADFLESSKVNNSQKRGSSSSSTSVVNTSAKSRNGGRPLPPPQPARRRMLPKEPTMNTVTTIKNTEKHAISSREEVEKSQLLKLLPTSDNSNRVLSSGNLSIAAEASDFDSISTTSASYVVNHSDVDSILNEEFSNNTVEGNDNETKSTDERQLLPDRFPPHMSIDAQATPSPLSSKKQQGQQISSPPALPKALPSSTTSTINDGQEHCATNTVAKAKSALGLPVSRSKKKEGDELPQGTKLAPSSPIQAGRTRPAKEVGPENQVEENEQKEQELEEVRSASNSTAVVIEEIRSEQGPPVKSSRKEKTVEIEPEAQTSDNIPTEEQVNANNNDLDDLVEATKPGEHNSPQQELKQRKGSVSDLIARFETSHSRKISSSSSTSNVDSLRSTRSVTPERNSRSITPDQRPSSANGQFTRSKSATPSLSGLAEESESKSEEVPSERGPIGSPIPETDEINIEHELEPEPEKEKPKPDTDEALETLPLGAEALTLEQEPTDEVSGEPGEPLDLEGLDEEMAKTLRNRNGGYTSYVFISSDPTQDDASSVVSVGSNKSVGDNRVRVNIKETGANCVVLQDGRASNISIVSTESSELGSPTSPINGNDEDELFMQRPQQVPELPAKIRSRNGGVIDLAQHFSPPPSLEYRARARGGEVPEPFEDEFLNRNEDTPSPPGDDAQNDRNGLANYFTNALEASGHPSSRRGRPPVIRAADRAARTRQHQMAPDQFDDDDDHDGMEGPVDGEGHDYMYDEDHEFQISELHDSSHPYDEEDVLYSDEYDPNYEVRYESGEEDEYGETVREYPMCQPVYDDSGDEYSEGEPLSSGDEYFDREEELRGYNRQIDFTLHTILEESCEDSEYESRSLEQHQQQKRQSDPSALERYFFYDVGGGNEDDTFSETSLNTTSERTHEEEDLSIAAEESASNRYDKYFAPPLGNGQNNPVESLEMISDVQTDDGGSVGSESDGQRSPNGFNKKKKVIRSKGFRTERLSDRGESDNGNSNVEDDPLHRPLEASYSNSSDDSHAQISGETQFDTMKRKKKQPRRTSVEDRKSDGERSADSRRPSGASVEQLGVINPLFKAPINVEDSLKKDGISPKGTPPITPLPSQIIEVQPASTSSGSSLEPVLQQSASPSGSEKEFDLMKQSKKSKAAQLLQRESSHASPTGSPPVNGPVRKHKSRDSGFVGSTDDLLRNETNQVGVTSSDSNHSLSDHENERKNSQPRLEKLSEVSENTEDDAENHQQHLVDIAFGKGDIKAEQIVNFQLPRRESPEAMRGPLNHSQLVRKDSFQNWSSDEDTNIMMNRMRSFFKGILAGHHGVTPESKEKPPQILAFEEQLTKLMRTVPGINEDQVKEIVEYLSSEDTWSDSYDSSDYTSSDLEGAYGYIDADIPDLNISPEIQQQISASCQEIIQKFDTGSSGAPQHANLSVDQDEFQKEAALMYQQLMAKMQQNQMEKELHRQASKSTRNSPPIAAKVMQHISTRLVALMHEAGGVNSDGGNSSPASITETTSGTFSDRRQVGPPTRRYKRVVPEDKKGDDAQGPNINAHLSKSSSKSVEALTANSSKKTANDYDVWQGVARDSNQTQGQPRRGSLGMVKSQMESLQSQSSSSINEDERCSWKGSFESTLAADISTKQRRVGSNSELNSSSIEQIDKSRSGSKSARGTRNSSRPTPSIVHTDSEDESVRTSSQNDPSASSTLPREHSLHSSSSSSVRSSVSSRHSTNSLPRLGTSAIKKSRAPQAPTSTATGPSQIMTTTVTLAAALSAGPNGGGSGPRSARYRPPGYKPAPTRKISPSMGHVLPQRKTSIEGVFVQRFNGRFQHLFISLYSSICRLCPYEVSLQRPEGEKNADKCKD